MKTLPTIYGIKNCDTMKKAFSWLKQHEIAYQFYDYKKYAPTAELIKQFITFFSCSSLINRQGLTWRKLSEQQRQMTKNETTTIELMIAMPSLIKRPIIIQNNQGVIGFSPESYRQFFVR